MGREVKRVPLNFNPPLDKIWWGYKLEPITCQSCHGAGLSDGSNCPCCEGKGKVVPIVKIPDGMAYQMWETVTEGSPLSPAFATTEELAHWLADNKSSAFGRETANYDDWLKMIKAEWSPTFAVVDGKLISGVEYAADFSPRE